MCGWWKQSGRKRHQGGWALRHCAAVRIMTSAVGIHLEPRSFGTGLSIQTLQTLVSTLKDEQVLGSRLRRQC